MIAHECPLGVVPTDRSSHRPLDPTRPYTPQERAEWNARENCERLPQFNLDGGCD
jgi:hypothetical protein